MMSLKTIGKTMIAWLVKAAKQRNVRRGFAGGIFFLLFTLIISLSFMPQQVDLKLGEVSRCV